MENASSARPQSSPGSTAICPGCGKGVDPLRAGHVAILGSSFVYFCDAHCKQVHSSLRSPASTLSPDEIMTAEPPQVAIIESGPRSRTNGSNGHSASNGSAGAHAIDGDFVRFPSSRSHAKTPAPPHVSNETPAPAHVLARSAEPSSRARRRDAITNEAGGIVGEDAAPAASIARAVAEPRLEEREDAPRTLRSAPLTAHTRAASLASSSAAVLRGVYIAGVVAGLLAPCTLLLGASADVARLPLALIASLCLIARFAIERRDPADAHGLVTLGPVVGAITAACWARATHDVRASSITILAGVAAASVLSVELLVARARAQILAARDRITRELAVRVRVLHGEVPVTVDADAVKAGEQVIIEEGEVVGVDAVVTAGEATVMPWLDAPVDMVKREGDAIVAGARVISGRLRVMTTWHGIDRAWMKLACSPTLRIDVAAPMPRATRLAIERGTPIAAALVGIAAFANNAPTLGIFTAACAAALATGGSGVASVIALHYARAQLTALGSGIVYKDARAFDQAGGADAAMLCARGTVLMGEPEIVTIEPIGAADVSRVLALAAGAETSSTHPFASTILRAARTRGVRSDNVRNATSHSGLGVTALASSGERLVVGSRGLMLKERISVALAEARINELEAQGRSVLLVAVADKLVGVLALQDGLRAGARAAVQRLLDARVEPVLLSGEARETCETIGRALDIDHIRPEILPSDRGAEVRAMCEGGHVVAAIGHPSTDDGALGAADVAVAMLAAGATPGEWSIALASDDVRDAASALTIPRATRDRSRVALAIGFTPGVVAMLAVAFGLAPLAVAPLAAVVGAIAILVHARD